MSFSRFHHDVHKYVKSKPAVSRKFLDTVSRQFSRYVKFEPADDTALRSELTSSDPVIQLSAALTSSLKHYKSKNTNDPYVAIALYYLSKTNGKYAVEARNIDAVLFSGELKNNQSFEAFFKWNPAKENANFEYAATQTHDQPILSIPEKSGQDYHFTSDSVEFIGRETELEALRRFCKADGTFKWWQLSGSSGQGKSRLALHFVLKLKELNPDWTVGYLDAHSLAGFSEKWNCWQPNKPHLLVVDDVLAITTNLKQAIQALAKKTDLAHPVRLLLIERQPWNLGGVQDDLSTGRADWYCQLTTYPTGHDKKLDLARFEDEQVANKEALKLAGLSPENLIQIARQAAKNGGRKLHHSDDAINKVLTRIDPERRPLFAFWVGRSLVEDQLEAVASSAELLNWILTDTRYRRWKPSFESIGAKAPQIGSTSYAVDGQSGQNPAMHLAILATMIDGFDVNEVDFPCEWTPHNNDVLTQAYILTDGPLTENPGTFIRPIGSHILGEWFVIQSISRQRIFFDIVELGWKFNPQEMAAFIVRLATDFPGNKTVDRIIAHMPELEGAQKIYASFAYDVLKSLHTHGCKIPEILILLLEQRAVEGDVIAMRALGYCHGRGLGLPVDHRAAAEWEKSAANAGDPVAMNNYGAALQMGRGVTKNTKAAMDWYQKSADLGYARAMANISWAYLNSDDKGVDTAKALQWIEKAIKLDQGYPIFVFGYCYEHGYEVAQDTDKAIELYKEAATNHCEKAMRELGRIYHKGMIVEKDLKSAIYWYEQAVARLDSAAMNDLAYCYWAGEGVTADCEKAIALYEKSAEIGYARAMYNLGCCYDNGHGVEQSHEKAADYYKQAADLGDRLGINNLAVCYRDGEGVDQNTALAIKLFETSADMGNARAMYNLAECHAKGVAGSPNLEQAIHWHKQAVNAGHEQSKPRLEKLISQVVQQQLAICTRENGDVW